MHETTDLTHRLWQFVQGNADAELEAHLQTCPECREQQMALSGLSALRALEDVPPIPDALNSTLTGLMSKVRPDLVPRPENAPSIGERLKTIWAELLQDTALQPQIVGLRGESRTRQIAFTSDVADLDLEVSPSEDDFLIVGQLGMDDVPHDLSIRFVPEGEDPLKEATDTTRAAQLSEQGYFRMNVSPGSWVIAVEIDDAVVVFPGIEL